MKKFIIARSVPGAGTMSQEEIAEIAKKSCAVVEEMGKPYHWIQSFITDDHIFCLHVAPDKETILKHSAMGCFPVDEVYEVKAMFDATTGRG